MAPENTMSNPEDAAETRVQLRLATADDLDTLVALVDPVQNRCQRFSTRLLERLTVNEPSPESSPQAPPSSSARADSGLERAA